jgi:dTMP kinase
MELKKKGIFIVIDGTDGSGKKTQTEMLANNLKQSGYEVETISFPQYGKKSA